MIVVISVAKIYNEGYKICILCCKSFWCLYKLCTGGMRYMNILLIGNGFDLAHGLPTKYTDFLEWVKLQWKLYDVTGVLEIFDYVIQNKWISYFFEVNSLYDNWVDFEREIGNIIKSIDYDMLNGFCDYDINNHVNVLSNAFLKKEFLKDEEITFKKIRDVLYDDLKKLCRAFEIYLLEDVERIEVEKISPDIEEINPDKVLSFNYTNTYEKLYGENINIEYDYIHGKANINNTIETNNMILGINEYLTKKKRNKYIDFIAFKKFYQRIYKETGCKYKEWVEEVRKNKEKQHSLYIFGHSLDVTDKDILRDFILNDNVTTTIYYFSKDDLGRKIANLVKVIGQDELIRRTGGSTKTIEFRLQKDMVKKSVK